MNPRIPSPRTAVPAAPPPRVPTGRMTLEKRTKGRQGGPLRVLVYGIEGVGKSTFAAGAPAPIFIGTEDGTAHLDVERFSPPEHWLDVLDAIEELRTKEHDRRTLVIDTLDWLEPMCWAHTCEKNGEKSIHGLEKGSEFGFYKGFQAALDEWRILIARLDALRIEKKMHLVMLAHAVVSSFKNPSLAVENYDRYTLKLQDAKKVSAAGLWKEWAEDLFFANFDDLSKSVGNGRAKGVTGDRVLHTTHSAAWDAKNRHDLPPEIPLDWKAFSEAATASRAVTPKKEEQVTT